METQVSKIINFTLELKEHPNSFSFNPCIAHWKENLYLVCYRNFIRDKNSFVLSEAEDNIYKFTHPWFGWKVGENGHDKTGFCIMKIENGNIKLVRSLHDGESIYYMKDEKNFYKSEDSHIVGQDCRIIKIKDNSFMISYNKFFYDEDIKLENGNNCQGGCTLIATRIVKIDEIGNLFMYEEQFLCPEISQQTEKNWSFFLYQDKILFSYGLTPTHLVYSTSIFEEEMLCGKLELKDKYEYYGNYEKTINTKKKDFLKISVSTPAVPNPYLSNHFIGVGHAKFKYGQIKKSNCKELGEFYSKVKKEIKKKHYTYVYLMFIYEFDATSGQITRISDMFIPQNSEYLLVFPTGLIIVDDEFWIFYGDHDSQTNIMTVNEEFFFKILKNVPEKENSFECQDINYFVFPQTCYKKSDLCLLLLS